MRSPSRAAPVLRGSPTISLRTALLSAALVDELTTGLLVVGLPLVRDRLHLSYEQAGLLFTVGGASSLVLDPLISILADREGKRRSVLLGVVGLVAGFALAGAAPNYIWLLLAFAMLFPASSAAVGVAQTALVDAAPAGVTRTMMRWEILASAGDLLAPAAVGVLVGVGVGWPALCLGGGACWLALGLAVVPHRFPDPASLPADEPDGAGTLTALRLAMRDRALLRWIGVELGSTMLDEVFVGFAALYLHDRLGASAAGAGIALLPGEVAAILALVALERVLLRVRGLRLLPLLALITLAGVVILLTAPSLWAATAGIAAVHAGAAGWYPIARAAAYDCNPGHPGLVHAVLGAGAPFELALPGVVGFLAAHLGIRAGVAFLGSAPIIVLLLAPRRITGPTGTPPAVLL